MGEVWRGLEVRQDRCSSGLIDSHRRSRKPRRSHNRYSKNYPTTSRPDRDRDRDRDRHRHRDRDRYRYRDGISLMDVFNIIYLGNDQVEPKKQLGTITLFSSPGLHYLYKVDKVDSSKPSISYGDAIDLAVNGEPTALSLSGQDDEDYVYMEFDLFSGAYKGTVDLSWSSPYDIKHEVSLNCVELRSTDCTGRILVNFGHFANATIANLEVRLLDKSAATYIYGVIFASNSKLDSSDAANVLFRKRPDNLLKLGHDGLIPLSKSLVAVPLHSELYVEVFLNVDGDDHKAILSFHAREAGEDAKSATTDKKARIHVNVTWSVDEDSIYASYHKPSVNRRTTNLSSVDKSGFEVEEAVAHEFRTLNDKLNKWLAEEPIHHISRSTNDILCEIICYSTDRVHPFTSVIDFVAKRVKQLDPVALFNLIQAAYHLEIKSLMDLTCRTLVSKVKTTTVEEIMKVFDLDKPYIRSEKRLKRGLQDSIKDRESLNVDSILRQRKKETFIDKSRFVDVPVSPFATERQCLVKKRNSIFGRCVSDFVESAVCQPRDARKMLEAIKWLNNLIDGDVGFADCLSSVAVEHLFQIVAKIDNTKDIDLTIQSLAVHILSRAVSRAKFHKYWTQAVPAFVKLMSDRLTDLNIVGVIALTRLSYTSAYGTQVILDYGALEKAHEIANKFNYSIPPNVSELIRVVAKFLAVVCYGSLPNDKVKVALAISEDLFQKDLVTYHHIESVCCALQYLTYKRTVAFEGEAWNKIIKRLIVFISNCFSIEDTMAPSFVPGVAGCALGVVGNIARWGHPDQIKTLTKDTQLLGCLGKILCSKFKNFSKEACQIIANMAARSETWIPNMHEAKLIEPLCSLLENDMYESDVKMEAVWAIFNGVYGDKNRQIDEYPQDKMPVSP